MEEERGRGSGTREEGAPARPGSDPDLPARAAEDIIRTCRDAWLCGSLRGFNGNMSLLLETGGARTFLITGTGIAKGHMTAEDLSLAAMDGTLLRGVPLSSETPMHAALYAARPDIRCVLHTHPPALLALWLRTREKPERFLAIPLFEAEVWRGRLGIVPELPPGSRELAVACARAATDPAVQAVFMAGHGLCALGRTAGEALAVCEQLEHLARTQLLAEN